MSEVINFTPRVASSLRRADELCRRFGQDTVGTEHLLMAFAEDAEGIAGQVIDQLGGRQRCLEILEEIVTSVGYNTPTGAPEQE